MAKLEPVICEDSFCDRELDPGERTCFLHEYPTNVRLHELDGLDPIEDTDPILDADLILMSDWAPFAVLDEE